MSFGKLKPHLWQSRVWGNRSCAGYRSFLPIYKSNSVWTKVLDLLVAAALSPQHPETWEVRFEVGAAGSDTRCGLLPHRT